MWNVTQNEWETNKIVTHTQTQNLKHMKAINFDTQPNGRTLNKCGYCVWNVSATNKTLSKTLYARSKGNWQFMLDMNVSSWQIKSIECIILTDYYQQHHKLATFTKNVQIKWWQKRIEIVPPIKAIRLRKPQQFNYINNVTSIWARWLKRLLIEKKWNLREWYSIPFNVSIVYIFICYTAMYC